MTPLSKIGLPRDERSLAFGLFGLDDCSLKLGFVFGAKLDELLPGSGFLGHSRRFACAHPRAIARAPRAPRAPRRRSSSGVIGSRAPAALASSARAAVLGVPSTRTGAKIGASSRDEKGHGEGPRAEAATEGGGRRSAKTLPYRASTRRVMAHDEPSAGI